jgi:hypothetical protein
MVPPIQWVWGAISVGVMRPGCEADHSPSSSAEFKEWVELYLHSPNTTSCHGTRAVCKARGLPLLLRVRTLWRCGDGLFFEVPHLASNALLTTLHPLLENVLQTVDHFEISCLGAPFSWFEKPRSCIGRDLNLILCSAWKKWISGTPLEHPPYSPNLAPCDY